MSIPTTTENPDANVIGRYSYDGSGARVKKVTSTETTVFVYDAGGALAAEYSTQAPPSDPKTAYLTTDHLGSPRVITDQTGQVTARRDFMPFGEELGVGVSGRTESLKYSNTGTDRGTMTEANSVYAVTNKRHVLLAILCIFLVGPLVDLFTMSSSTAYAIGLIASNIAVLAACIIWVHIDAGEKNIPVGHGFRISMVLLMPVVLTYYFYKSRGAKRGTITLLKAGAFFLTAAILSTVIAIIINL